MTELLYYSTPIITECGAAVLSCEKDERSGAYKIILDRTMIYPEGGGQSADRGSIGFRPDNSAAEQTVRISDAHTENGSVVHFCDAEIPAGTIVRVVLDVDTRLDHAQQHTGEHIVSGLASKLFGAVNVGFHMAADYCTIDFDIPLEQAQLEELERAANAAVRANLSVHTEVTTPEDASTRTLRKKSDKAVGNDKNKKSDKPQNNICEPVPPAKAVRIVYIDNGKIDSCTCCGTHLAATGGVGTILFTDAQHYKGGTRLWFVCGGRATAAVRTVQNIVSALAKQYSTSREELPAAIRKQADELASSKSELREKSRRLASAESVSLLSTAERIKGIAVVCSVMDGSTANDLKLTADELCKKDSTVPCVSLLFAPNAGGTDYCMACTEDAAIKLSMRELCTAVNCIMNGKGGGNQLLARGKTTRTVQKSDCDMLRSYIEKVLRS